MDWLDSLIGSASDAYAANQQASAAKKAANAELATANASVLSSRNMIIAGVIVAVVVVLGFLFTRK